MRGYDPFPPSTTEALVMGECGQGPTYDYDPFSVSQSVCCINEILSRQLVRRRIHVTKEGIGRRRRRSRNRRRRRKRRVRNRRRGWWVIVVVVAVEQWKGGEFVDLADASFNGHSIVSIRVPEEDFDWTTVRRLQVIRAHKHIYNTLSHDSTTTGVSHHHHYHLITVFVIIIIVVVIISSSTIVVLVIIIVVVIIIMITIIIISVNSH